MLVIGNVNIYVQVQFNKYNIKIFMWRSGVERDRYVWR